MTVVGIGAGQDYGRIAAAVLTLGGFTSGGDAHAQGHFDGKTTVVTDFPNG